MARSEDNSMGEPGPEALAALRIDLAAAFRLAVKFDWHESVGNHFSAAVSADGKRFLMNPRWKHFGSIRASDLLLLDADDASVMEGPQAPDPSAWCIHGTIHRERPSVRVILHCHPPYATALACLKDPAMLPIDQNTARFFGQVGIDTNFGGIADEAEEGRRLAAAFGNHSVLLMGNHGVTVTGPTVAEAFEHLYFFERAAKTLVLAYSTGKPLAVMADDLAQKTAEDWLPYRGMAYEHFDYLKSTLDAEDRSWRL
ncbi:class II aldolase/adducin family protein [Gellertiella hungarica]|uniref:Ribulose-5-phosphate 4-epimerase/fuculose-1-phosphate aldolase n=1 Tax=Gellertiella hungarica TaxID=1572859 RepID=A0A7W6J890_9HYPH|nr:class II aldolase/adducin family protein [Gellertiella hungarica]MBB4066615.1 ribulose-5-phosphate 4-epimerase/fuculose-1-phosphate aldolase [Gellertiella hungarica]